MDINVTILGQAITFAILVIFTMKFVWPPLNRMLEERANRIAEGLSAAEKGRQELADAEKRVAAELQKVQLRATEIMTNAQKSADHIIQEASIKAENEAQRIVDAAKKEIEQETIKAREDLRKELGGLVIKGASQVLKAEIGEKEHAELLAKLVMEL